MQRGTIRREGSSWFLYYRDDGKQKCHRLASALLGARSIPADVRLAADKFLEPINARKRTADSLMGVREFAEYKYLVAAKEKLRPSTYREYEHIILKDIKPRISPTLRLCDFTTPAAQEILETIHKANPVSHQRMLRIRAALSAVFTYAMNRGVLLSNPVRATKAPGKRTKYEGETYTLAEIFKQLDALRKSEYGWIKVALIGTFAFLGLRASEVRGLQWGDFKGDTIEIRRSVWRKHVGPTKTVESEAAIPVIPVLQKLLEGFKEGIQSMGGSTEDDDFIFAGPKNGSTNMPLNLNNFFRRFIKPVFDEEKLRWKGYPAYRRSLASTLYSLGAKPRVIAQILRHASPLTTLQYYIKSQEDDSKVELDKIQKKMKELFDAAKTGS